ncbi:MAG: radical SAM protein [Theionarchaea archaeon]|nr:radical SAM protein [Theionarchaea archaeon]
MLEHYHAVTHRSVPPHYSVTRGTLIQADCTDSVENVWKAHDAQVSGSVSLLEVKIEIARRIFTHCEYCERRCGVNRRKEVGNCGVRESKIASEFAHYGEERVLIPSHTIFFSGCNFHCVYCQNWDISQVPCGRWIPPGQMASRIESRNLRNMNFVGGDPTPNLGYILEVLDACSAPIPVVWNSNMYLTEESMKLLDGVTDVYLTDFKYGNDRCAEELSKVKNYWEIITRNHSLAQKNADLIIRHLVLPDHLECCTYPILEWISGHLEDAAVNVMFQYRPEYKAMDTPRIDRFLTGAEKERALEIAREFNITLI